MTAAPLAMPVPEPQRGFNIPNLAGQLAGNFGNIAGQLAGNLGNLAGNFGNLAGNLVGNLSNIGADFLGNIPTLGDLCVVPILCDFIKIVETQQEGTAEEKEVAVKAFLADWEHATPEAKQLFAPPPA